MGCPHQLRSLPLVIPFPKRHRSLASSRIRGIKSCGKWIPWIKSCGKINGFSSPQQHIFIPPQKKPKQKSLWILYLVAQWFCIMCISICYILYTAHSLQHTYIVYDRSIAYTRYLSVSVAAPGNICLSTRQVQFQIAASFRCMQMCGFPSAGSHCESRATEQVPINNIIESPQVSENESIWNGTEVNRTFSLCASLRGSLLGYILSFVNFRVVCFCFFKVHWICKKNACSRESLQSHM